MNLKKHKVRDTKSSEINKLSQKSNELHKRISELRKQGKKHEVHELVTQVQALDNYIRSLTGSSAVGDYHDRYDL